MTQFPKTLTSGYYVYGFVHTPGGHPRDALPLPPELKNNELKNNNISKPLQLVHHEDIAALVRPINPDSFAETLRQELINAERNLSADSWIARQAVLHDAVIGQYLGLGICPARFGTILPDDTALQTLLSRHYDKVLASLTMLAGKREWTLRLWLLAESNPVTNPVTHPTASASGGRAYLQARRDELVHQSARAQQAVRLRDDLHDLLEAEGILFKASEHSPAQDASKNTAKDTQKNTTRKLAAQFIVLLDDQQQHNLVQHYAQSDQVQSDQAQLEFTGPFAPYSFSDILSDFTDPNPANPNNETSDTP